MPRIQQIVETAIYTADLARSVDFYRRVLGLERQFSDERFCAFAVAPGQVFLIFNRDMVNEGSPTPGGFIPSHAATGPQHFAFGIALADLDSWQERLTAAGVSIESLVDWPFGGRSLFFRDPDGHLAELQEPGRTTKKELSAAA
ncbi:MAG TPA: VOC family protein [Bryobacteraceae bacterium]